MTDEKYRKLQKEIEKLEREYSQAVGAKKQIEETLKNEFNCNSIAAAERLLEKLKREQEKNAIKFRKQFRKFKEALRLYNQTVTAFATGTPITKTVITEFENDGKTRRQKSGGRD